jgi:hypothetical protein
MMFSRELAVQDGLRGGLGPFWRIQAWALERAAAIHCQSGDLRWVTVTLGLDVLAALDGFIERQLAAWAQKIITRALAGARFAAAADTTVAAGGSQGRALFRAIGSLA